MNTIVFCPCCTSAVDTTTGPERQQLDCPACGQRWWMTVDEHRQAAHSH